MTGLHQLLVWAAAAADSGGRLPLGYLVVGIIEAPVIVLLLASLLGKPRQPRIIAVFLGFLVFMVLAFLGSVFGLSHLLSIFY